MTTQKQKPYDHKATIQTSIDKEFADLFADLEADAKSEKAWDAIRPEAHANDGAPLQIVGVTAVGSTVEVHSVPSEYTVPVHVQHPEVS